MTYGGGWGTGEWGTGIPLGSLSIPAPAAVVGPYLVSSSPANGATSQLASQEVDFLIDANTGINSATLTVYLDGAAAIINGVYQAGYTGVISSPTGTSKFVTIVTHPAFVHQHVDTLIMVSDFSANAGIFSFSFNLVLQSVSSLTAKSWCDGNRIDLAWVNPAGVTQIKIRRSQFSYCRFIDDPGTDVYTGAPITNYIDGPGPNPHAYQQSTTALSENTFYYYSIFISYSGSPYQWLYFQNGQVEGLSIKDYFTLHGGAGTNGGPGPGDYVYNLLPLTYRRRDSDPTMGTDRYKLRDFCRVLQCSVNLYRGWNEGLLQLRDPDNMPAGRLGEAENQAGILSALSWDLGLPPERSFDAGVLRRVAMGLIPVYQAKGTCPGLVALTKLFAGWNSRCDEAILPLCGIDRLFYTWDGTSRIDKVIVTINADNPTLGVAGQATIKQTTMFLPDGATVDLPPATSSFLSTVAFIIDAMGTYACVSSVGSPSSGSVVFTFDDVLAKLRSSITGSGTGAANQFTITSIDVAAYPWQFPSSGGYTAPTFGLNAWAGYFLKDSAANLFPITASATTSGGNTILTVTGNPANGVFTLAYAFDGAKNALFNAQLYIGEYSLVANPRWDVRSNDEGKKGPWSLITSIGSINPLFFAPTPADVTVWASGVYTAIGKATAVGSVTLSDGGAAWTTNQWAGYYLLPNWNQTRVFRITGNTATVLSLDVPSGGGINTVAGIGSHYTILTEKNALKYSQLVRLLPSFIPEESRGFVKFE